MSVALTGEGSELAGEANFAQKPLPNLQAGSVREEIANGLLWEPP